MTSPLSIIKSKSFKQDWLVLICYLYLIWNYIAHGVQALMMAEKYHPITEFLGLPVWTLVIVGLIDIAIAILLFFKPSKWVVLYAMFWPFIPMTLEYLVSGDLEIIGKVILLVCGVVILIKRRA